MRLTPADVHNVAFKKPSIGKRGYDEDEVDQFLDLVEEEFSRLIEENNELTQRLAAYEAVGPAPVQTDGGPSVQQVVENAPVEQVHEHEAPAPVAPPVVAAPVQAAPVQAPPVQAQPVAVPQPSVAAAPVGAEDHHLKAARLLGLAQDTAERLTAEARNEAEAARSSARAESEKMLTDARTESERMVTDAKNQSEAMLTDAKNRSESMVSEASAKADATLRDSQIKAEALDREAQGKYAEVMSQLTEQRTALEKKIDGLRAYEREYRSRLKGWITDQLAQLDESGNNSQAARQVTAP